jgi:hypothetical protein
MLSSAFITTTPTTRTCSVLASYVRPSHCYNFDSPAFVGRDAVVLKRKAPAQDTHT